MSSLLGQLSDLHLIILSLKHRAFSLNTLKFTGTHEYAVLLLRLHPILLINYDVFFELPSLVDLLLSLAPFTLFLFLYKLETTFFASFLFVPLQFFFL